LICCGFAAHAKVISLMEKTLQVLNDLVRDEVLSRCVIGGAMGATFYAEPVLTFDLDIFVTLPQTHSTFLTLEPLYDALRSRGYTEAGECVNIEGIPVQFLPAHNDLLVEALIEACEVFYEQTTTRVVRAEHLVAIALQTGRDPRARATAATRGEAGQRLPRGRASPPWSGSKMEAMDTPEA
jgi:hypothetical protein